MKKTIYLLATSFFLYTATNAQLSFGLKAGGQRTALPGTNDNHLYKYGFYAGLATALPLNKTFSLQAEVYYSQQGNKELTFADETAALSSMYPTAAMNDRFIEVPAPFNYINVPVLLKYRHRSGLFLETGLQVGFLVSAKIEMPRGDYDINYFTKDVDLAAAWGAGFELKNGAGINFRYNLGLLDVNKHENNKRHNSVAQLGLFYMLKKVRK